MYINNLYYTGRLFPPLSLLSHGTARRRADNIFAA
jgi:hypothetical protein